MIQETIENIENNNMLVPSFKNNNDMPEDISDLPFRYNTYISGFPLLQRLERFYIIIYLHKFDDTLATHQRFLTESLLGKL